MRPAAALVLACLVALQGCMTASVEGVKDGGAYHQGTSAQTPERAAGCIARNLEAALPGASTSVRASQSPGAWEVAGWNYFAYATAVPAPTGSELSVWITKFATRGAEMAHKALAGC